MIFPHLVSIHFILAFFITGLIVSTHATVAMSQTTNLHQTTVISSSATPTITDVLNSYCEAGATEDCQTENDSFKHIDPHHTVSGDETAWLELLLMGIPAIFGLLGAMGLL